MDNLWKYGSTIGCQLSALPMIQSPIIDSIEEAPVDILIEAENKRWNIDLVDGLSAPSEAEIIK